MHGSSDRITSLQASREFAAKMVKSLDFNIWEGFYHELHNEPEKQQVLDYLGNWLSTCITVSEMRKKK
jgi:alpha-beta hydrolase superfamily lysophospholipase